MNWMMILAGVWTLIAVWFAGFVTGQRVINRDLCKTYYNLGKNRGRLEALSSISEYVLHKLQENQNKPSKNYEEWRSAIDKERGKEDY